MKKTFFFALLVSLTSSISVYAAQRALTTDEEITLLNRVDALCGDTACEGDVEFHFHIPNCRWQEAAGQKTIACSMYARLIFEGSQFVTSCTVGSFKNKEQVLAGDENSFAVRVMDCFSEKAATFQKAVALRSLHLTEHLVCASPSLEYKFVIRNFNTLVPTLLGIDAQLVASTINRNTVSLGFSNERDNSYEFTFDTTELQKYAAGQTLTVPGKLQYTVPNMPESSGGQITEEVKCWSQF